MHQWMLISHCILWNQEGNMDEKYVDNEENIDMRDYWICYVGDKTSLDNVWTLLRVRSRWYWWLLQLSSKKTGIWLNSHWRSCVWLLLLCGGHKLWKALGLFRNHYHCHVLITCLIIWCINSVRKVMRLGCLNFSAVQCQPFTFGTNALAWGHFQHVSNPLCLSPENFQHPLTWP